MKKLCEFLQAFPWVTWVLAAVGLLATVLGTPRLSGGPMMEQLVSAGKIGALTIGIILLQSVAYPPVRTDHFWSPRRETMRLGLAALSLAILIGIILVTSIL